MGQVVDFVAFKRRRNIGELQTIESLKRQIAECDRLLHTSPSVRERERAVIRSLELKMEVAERSRKLGIMR
jgi:hypothetical protein